MTVTEGVTESWGRRDLKEKKEDTKIKGSFRAFRRAIWSSRMAAVAN